MSNDAGPLRDEGSLPAEGRGEVRVGAHSCRFEAPDILVLTIRGDESAAEARALVAAIHALAEDRERVFILANVTCMGLVEAEARKISTGVTAVGSLRAISVYGGGFAQRVMAKLVLAVVDLLGQTTGVAIRMFDTEAQARAFIDKLRHAPN